MGGHRPAPAFHSRLANIRSAREPVIDAPSAGALGCKTPTHKAPVRMPDAPVVGVTALRWSAAGEDTWATDQF
jgi:hypothetical protein